MSSSLCLFTCNTQACTHTKIHKDTTTHTHTNMYMSNLHGSPMESSIWFCLWNKCKPICFFPLHCACYQQPPSLTCISTMSFLLASLPPWSLQAIFLIAAKESLKVPSIIPHQTHPCSHSLLKYFKSSLQLLG